MTSILFVCSGNIFRSLVAEYALKAHLGSQAGYLIGSAGIEASPQEIHPVVLAALLEKGVDPSGHRQRKLTQALIDSASVAVAMGKNHQAWIRGEFGREVPLFNHLCYGIDQPILDVHEILPDWRDQPEQARAYLHVVIEHIWSGVPHLLDRLPTL
ncbi:MAG: low molecular weight phosphatase family protein [Nitrospira sp.]|jgi:protein-tyrosine phosphatase|nr:low molecular weight phosphatase family protein [Nitrospira sp.]MBP6606139.1 low molecular weight phosphatase family protein [Nitrospira sp.]HQY56266.1 low molecular weight phosphatase family protein [Nitrospira sp.]HRA96497.1 low molecular weight phosphatase family protein [Nitrospira sp.]